MTSEQTFSSDNQCTSLKRGLVCVCVLQEMMRTQLAFLRAKHMGTLRSHAAEISATENSIYENGVKLEQVNMENSRMHLVRRQSSTHTSDFSSHPLTRPHSP